jgi:putative SOS response-associated peptidase YedK
MCGRFAFYGNGSFGYESLHLPEPPRFENYNIAPIQDILAIRIGVEPGQAEYDMLHWGLVPFWSKEAKTKFPLINARADGIE